MTEIPPRFGRPLLQLYCVFALKKIQEYSYIMYVIWMYSLKPPTPIGTMTKRKEGGSKHQPVWESKQEHPGRNIQ